MPRDISTLQRISTSGPLGTGPEWSTSGSNISETGGRLVINPLTAFPGARRFTTSNIYSFTSSFALIEMPVVPATIDGTLSYFGVESDSTNHVRFQYVGVSGGLLNAVRTVSGTSTTLASQAYSALAHRWLRLRESGGTTYWDTSPDGVTWQAFTQQANPINPENVGLAFGGYTYLTVATPGGVEFDNLNFPPAPPLTSPPLFASTLTAMGPGLYLRLGESTGQTTAADASGNNRNGTYSPTGVTYGWPGGLLGDPSTSVRFAATDGYVQVPNASTIINGRDATLVALVNIPNNATTSGLVGIRGDLDRGLYLLRAAGTNTVQAHFRGDGGVGGSTSATITPNVWHLLVAAYHRGQGRLRIDVDGEAVASVTLTPGTVLTASNLRLQVGRLDTADNGGAAVYSQTAAIDEVALFPSYLTGGQSRDLWDAMRQNYRVKNTTSSIETGTRWEGAYSTGNLLDVTRPTGLDTHAANAARPTVVAHHFQAWGDTANRFPLHACDQALSRNAVPLITWEPWVAGGGVTQASYQLGDIIAGAYDAYITQWALECKAYGEGILLRFAHEMNGNGWTPWQEGYNGNTAGQFVTAWRHVHDLFTAQNVTNVRWVWCPNVDLGNPSTGWTYLPSLYPGDAYVDWLGLDGFNWGATTGHTWQTFAEVFGATYTRLATIAPSKPLLLGEVASTETGGSKAAWITDAFTVAIPTTTPSVRGVVWMDADQTSTGGLDWRITSSTTARDAYRAAIVTGSDFYGMPDDINIGIASRIPWQNQNWYLHGCNLPWYNWEGDFGGGTNGVANAANRNVIDAAFSRAAASGMRTIRWWCFEGSGWQVTRDGANLPTGLNSAIYVDFDAALELAAAHDVYLVFNLFSSHSTVPATWTTDPLQRAALGAVLEELFARYANHPRILAWEPFNEPEFQVTNGTFTMADVVATGKAISDAVHRRTNALTAVANGHIDFLNYWVGNGFDFYSPHWYDYMNGGGWDAWNHTYAELVAQEGLDGPVVIGEFYAGPTPRWEGFYTRGYAGAWAWSLLSDRTSDGLTIPDAEAAAFAAAHADTGPRENLSAPLGTPTNLIATAASPTQINLAWVDNATAESGYSIEVSTNGGLTWSVLATVSANTNTYSHTGLTAGTTRRYRVRAYAGTP